MALARFFAIFLVLALVAVALPGRALAGSADFMGDWDVNTTLVAASGAVNQDYKPGDLRIEVWRISGSLDQPVLTTKDGSIHGRISGDAAQFLADVPVGQIVVMRIRIEAGLTSSRSMRGTINADYWDRRFGTKIGLDAWTFEAQRR